MYEIRKCMRYSMMSSSCADCIDMWCRLENIITIIFFYFTVCGRKSGYEGVKHL